MMIRPRLLLRGSFVVAGLALATLAVQHALNVDSAAVVRPEAAGAAVAPRRAYPVVAAPGSSAGRLLGPSVVPDLANAARRRGDTLPESPNEIGTSSEAPGDAPVLNRLSPAAEPERNRATDSGGGVRVSTPSSSNPTATASASSPAVDDRCGPPTVPPPQGVTANVDFVGVLLNGTERNADSFSGAQLGDLKILVQWHHLLQNHAQRLDLIAPDGSLYQSLSRPLTLANEGTDVETRVPVNGTWITRYGLYGTWCVAVFFDQAETPVTTARVAITR